MQNIYSIVNFLKHPIHDINYIDECKTLIKKNSLLVLENFLSDESLINILHEAKLLESKAFIVNKNTQFYYQNSLMK